MAGEGRVTPQVAIRHRYLDGASLRSSDDGMPPVYSRNDPQIMPFVSAPATGLEGIDSLFHVPSFRSAECMTWWLGTMPSETEAAAAYLLAFSMADGRLAAPESVNLGEFAEATESLGPVAATLLLARLNSADPAQRASLLDTLATLATGGHLPGHDLGDQLGLLVTYDLVTLSRITSALAETARAGFGAQVWPIVAAALPRLLPTGRERGVHGLAALIALGADSAPPGAGTEIPGLAVVVTRGGSSRIVREATRLTRLLRE